MRYELKRNKNGMITQCDNNADGGNIYAQREEINKVALKNLERPTPGKLGNLSNLQVFNFTIGTFATGTADFVFKEYNTGSTFPANTVDTIMFGVDSLNNKGLYYNIKDVRINLLRGDRVELLPDSFVEFYLVQNNETSTSSLGTKIPQPAPLFGSSSGTVTFTTAGNEQGNQYISTAIGEDATTVTNNSKGIRASGLALKIIQLNFSTGEALDDLLLDVQVYVDTSSVSSTY